MMMGWWAQKNAKQSDQVLVWVAQLTDKRLVQIRLPICRCSQYALFQTRFAAFGSSQLTSNGPHSQPLLSTNDMLARLGPVT
jgi:hypothetical protein